MYIAGFIGPQEIIVIFLFLAFGVVLLVGLTARRSRVSCPKCGHLTRESGFSLWQYLVSIFFFPLGLLSLLAGRKPTKCENCGYIWRS